MFVAKDTFTWNMVAPKMRPDKARQNAGAWGASLTFKAGDLIGQKTSDKLLYRHVAGAVTDGIGDGAAKGVAPADFVTDANGRAFWGDSLTERNAGPSQTVYYWESDMVWDVADLKIGGAATTEAAVRTAFGAARVITLPNGFLHIL